MYCVLFILSCLYSLWDEFIHWSICLCNELSVSRWANLPKIICSEYKLRQIYLRYMIWSKRKKIIILYYIAQLAGWRWMTVDDGGWLCDPLVWQKVKSIMLPFKSPLIRTPFIPAPLYPCSLHPAPWYNFNIPAFANDPDLCIAPSHCVTMIYVMAFRD